MLGSVVGAVLGSLVGALLLPPVADPRMRAPGDGIVILMCAGIGVTLGIVLAVVLAIQVWERFEPARTNRNCR